MKTDRAFTCALCGQRRADVEWLMGGDGRIVPVCDDCHPLTRFTRWLSRLWRRLFR